MFDLKNKVALVTGAASGIGLEYVKELLRCGVRGVTIADVRADLSSSVLKELQQQFGSNKAIFVETNVTNFQQFEDAFKKTVDTFGNVDILVNNAGIINDTLWQEEIQININGVVHGMLLGFEKYIPKYKSGAEGVIVNISSIAGVNGFPNLPVYSGTKFAVTGMTKAWGCKVHYDRTKIKVVALCPGSTDTPLLRELGGKTLGESYKQIAEELLSSITLQTPQDCAKRISKIITNSESGTVWVVEDGEEPYEYVIAERETMKK